ncbi:hypothetical protein SBI_02974 [Streptomyces bingchenggensis BCW-1]|uniref:Uncharacterized protein n=1 Tax=Streptomyces bingchenggensis (strain BCW-1) TaxID=749414 RepID=D7C4P4_STRBB|nr:hypothetical protein SBI_02974 [Streptomyces bingchenggensis BCW-1]
MGVGVRPGPMGYLASVVRAAARRTASRIFS